MGSDVQSQMRRIEAAVAASEGVVPSSELETAREEIAAARDRHAIAGGRTVVALMGGTGSGKSSLFNALTRSSFAETGPIRPTTRQPAACSWGDGAEELLGHLGIAGNRRMVKDPFLTRRADMAGLEGLVLLDLPDQDSVIEGHALQVDRLIPMVDLLIWMVDPQKYADNVLHEHYLMPLAHRAAAMMVVVNHADALTPEGLESVLGDVRRLLEDEALESVPVVATSVPSGRGVPEVLGRIREAVASESLSDATARATLSEVAGRPLERFGEDEPALSDDVVTPTVDALVRATGTESVADAVERNLSRVAGGTTEHTGAPTRAVVAAIGSGWSSHAKRGLPKPWARAVDDALPSVEALTTAVGAAAESVPVPGGRVRRADLLLGGAGAAFLAGLAALAVGGFTRSIVPTVVVLAVAVAVAALLAVVSVRVRREEADAEARRYARETRAAIQRTVDELLVTPTRAVLRRHREIREALESARA